jgi:hypothetical protein
MISGAEADSGADATPSATILTARCATGLSRYPARTRSSYDRGHSPLIHVAQPRESTGRATARPADFQPKIFMILS